MRQKRPPFQGFREIFENRVYLLHKFVQQGLRLFGNQGIPIFANPYGI